MTRLSVERLDELRRHATEAPEYMGGCLDLLGHIDAMETELTDLRTRLLVMTRERDEMRRYRDDAIAEMGRAQTSASALRAELATAKETLGIDQGENLVHRMRIALEHAQHVALQRQDFLGKLHTERAARMDAETALATVQEACCTVTRERDEARAEANELRRDPLGFPIARAEEAGALTADFRERAAKSEARANGWEDLDAEDQLDAHESLGFARGLRFAAGCVEALCAAAATRALDAEAAVVKVRTAASPLCVLIRAEGGHGHRVHELADALQQALAISTPDLATDARREWEARGIEEMRSRVVAFIDAHADDPEPSDKAETCAYLADAIRSMPLTQKRQGGGT